MNAAPLKSDSGGIAPIQVTVLCFSRVRQALGRSQFTLELPSGASTEELEKRVREGSAGKLDQISFQIAVNQSHITEPVSLNEGDEVALIPPVQGG